MMGLEIGTKVQEDNAYQKIIFCIVCILIDFSIFFNSTEKWVTLMFSKKISLNKLYMAISKYFTKAFP